MAHFFTVDVEEHFQVSAFEGVAPRATWGSHPSRVVANTGVLLELLARHQVRGTFFVLGWVAERQPALIRRIASAGHELASHGWWHLRVNTIDRDAFREEISRSKRLIEDLSGTLVDGYRAPSFSLTPGTEWAFEVLGEEGYRYDSSIFPIRRAGYGYPGAPRDPYSVAHNGGSLVELPMATWAVGPWRIPAAGGGYLRHFPEAVIHSAFRQADRRGQPGMFYIHPWEVDPEQPRLPVDPLTAVRHYRGLDRTIERLERLLTRFRFTSVRAWLERQGSQ